MLVDQLKSFDWTARKAPFHSKADPAPLAKVRSDLGVLLGTRERGLACRAGGWVSGMAGKRTGSFAAANSYSSGKPLVDGSPPLAYAIAYA